MKLKEYLKAVVKELNNIDRSLEVGFDLGLEPDMEVNQESKNRIKFTICHFNYKVQDG